MIVCILLRVFTYIGGYLQLLYRGAMLAVSKKLKRQIIVKILRQLLLLLVALLMVNKSFGETPPTKIVRIKPRKIEVDNRQFGKIEVEDKRIHRDNIGYLQGFGKSKTFLELDESLEKVFTKFLQKSLSPIESEATLILRIHSIECRNKPAITTITAKTEMDVEFVKKTPSGEETIFREIISKEYSSYTNISARTFGKLIEDILEECLIKANKSLLNN